jgi:hypothetical protein
MQCNDGNVSNKLFKKMAELTWLRTTVIDQKDV